MLRRTLLVLFCASCASTDYQGDGGLVDHGPFAAKDRFVLDLGAIDLSRPATSVYKIGKLPRERFVIGIEINEAQANYSGGPRPSHSARIRLVLENEDKQVVISEDALLSSWRWSFGEGDPKSFLYRLGKGEKRFLDDGSWTSSRVDVGPDEGWGTFFVPRPDTKYRLTVHVLEAQAFARPAHLIIKGGGWK